MLMKIIDGTDRRWLVQKSKGRQELHRGLLLRLWPLEKIHFDSFPVFRGLFWSLCYENMPLVTAEVDVRGAGWSEKLRCPCFNDKRQNIRSPH